MSQDSKKYPYLLVDMGRNYKPTQVRVLFVNNTMNMEVRIGTESVISADAMFTKNQRCGLYYGPSQAMEWVRIECHRAILGRYK